MKIGKLDSDVLKRIVFDTIQYRRDDVLVRPGIGEDCAVVDFDDNVCVMSTDPITGAVNDIGKIAVHISCNDIASNGLAPLGIMLAIMVPEGTTENDIETIMRQAAIEAEKLQVEIIGGHTEITDAVNKPIIVSTAIGKGKKEIQEKMTKAKPGDAILMTKTAGMEGTGIIISDHMQELGEVLTKEEIESGVALLDGLSVVPEGVVAGQIGVSAMHDVTEGGILGAVWEICECANTGVEIHKEQIPVEPVTLKVCDFYKLDYLKLISSGSMIICVSEERKEQLMQELEDAGVQVAEIGVLTEGEKVLISDSKRTIIESPKSDELYKV